MTNLVSPGIVIRERELSANQNTVSISNVGVIVGAFTQVMLIH